MMLKPMKTLELDYPTIQFQDTLVQIHHRLKAFVAICGSK